MKKSKKSNLLINSMRSADELFALLDAPIIRQEDGTPLLPKWKPYTPAQIEKTTQKAFTIILDQLNFLRLDLLQKHSNINELRAASIALLKKEEGRRKDVINPKTITILRSIALLDKRVQFIEALFSEVLQAYQRQTGKDYNPGGTIK
jgi:flagellar motility protein MotE (MotC chaperone)